VEHDRLDAGLPRGLGDGLADSARLVGLVAREALDRDPARAGERLAVRVVDELREDPAVRAEDREARPLRRALDLPAHAAVAALARLAGGQGAHARFPTFRRTNSPS